LPKRPSRKQRFFIFSWPFFSLSPAFVPLCQFSPPLSMHPRGLCPLCHPPFILWLWRQNAASQSHPHRPRQLHHLILHGTQPLKPSRLAPPHDCTHLHRAPHPTNSLLHPLFQLIFLHLLEIRMRVVIQRLAKVLKRCSNKSNWSRQIRRVARNLWSHVQSNSLGRIDSKLLQIGSFKSS
jgi:hypothetical protein